MLRFNPWPRNFHAPQVQPKKKKKKKKKRKGNSGKRQDTNKQLKGEKPQKSPLWPSRL